MKKLVNVLGYVLISIVITGCVVNAPQLERLREAIGSVGKNTHQEEPESLLWTARIGDQGQLLRVYKEGELFVFISESGDTIAVFDGWHIRSFLGFGFDGIQRVIVEGDLLQFVSSREAKVVQCDPWSKTTTDKNHVFWQRHCDGQIRPNVIHVLPDGNIFEIEQVITASQDRILIRRL